MATCLPSCTLLNPCPTGYIQRRLVKAMEDLITRYDGTVRTAVGSIVQFLYGEDGMDGVRIEGQSLDHLKLDVSALPACMLVYLSACPSGWREYSCLYRVLFCLYFKLVLRCLRSLVLCT